VTVTSVRASQADLGQLQAGAVLFEHALPPAGRERVALFSIATQDPNPIHVDDDFARRAGFPNVLQQGPMTTAQFARLLEECAGTGRLRTLDITFTAPVFPEDALTLRAEVTAGGAIVQCALTATKADGTRTATGIAELSSS
jgi:acyl dehydratase